MLRQSVPPPLIVNSDSRFRNEINMHDAPLLTVPRVRTELARRAFSVAAPQTWNSLPADIRSCVTLQTFKRHLKTTFSLILNWRHKRLCIPRRTLWRYTNVVLLLLYIMNHIGGLNYIWWMKAAYNTCLMLLLYITIEWSTYIICVLLNIPKIK